MTAMHSITWASQVALVVKKLPASVGRMRTRFRSPSQEDPLEEGMHRILVLLPGEPHGHRSLASCRVAESDLTEATQDACAHSRSVV